MSTAATLTLVCPDCRRENEPERIYCHDCGARLDRSALAAQKAATTEAPEQSRERLQHMFSARRGRIRRWALAAGKLLLAALAAALLLLIFLPVDLPPEKKQAMLPPQINLDLENMTQSRRPAQLRYSEDDVNAFLANALRSRKKQLDHSVLEFRRAVISFSPETFRLAIERALFGYSLYSSATYSLEKNGDKLTASPHGVWLGRLPIHPILLKYAGFLDADVVQAVNQERRLLERVGTVGIGDREVTLTAPR